MPSITRKPRRLVTIAAAAAQMGVNPRTIRRWIADGRITGYRLGAKLIRVDLTELDDRILSTIPTVGGASNAISA